MDSFGTDPDAQIKYIEISRSNPDVIYLSQQPASGNLGKIWKTTDGGATWTSIPMPSGANRRKILLALDPEDSEKLYAAFPDASNGNKVFRTTDGGNAWTNLTSSALDGEAIHSIVLVGGTNGGLYACTNRSVFYRDDALGSWVVFDTGLPVNFNSNIGKAFYRDGKIRVASYGKAIWQSDFHTPQSRPICTPMVQHPTAICSADTFYFEDHSMLNHSGATWSWTFQGGTPATSTQRNPAVTFNGTGSHLVTLTVTDGNGQSDTDSLTVTLTGVTATSIATDFEAGFPPAGYTLAATGNLTWAQANSVGGYGNSPTSSKCDNFNVDGGGTSADLRTYVNFSNIQNAKVTFDVAYAEYGGQYTDTLEVLASSDCGLTFTRLYRKGGQTLATSPNVTANEFVPTNTQWRTDTVDLSTFQGFSEVVVVFRSIGHFGQTMYIDNINVAGLVGVDRPEAIGFATLAPNPALVGSSLRFSTNLDEQFELRMYDAQGKVIRQAWVSNGAQVSTAGLAAGQYFYLLQGQTILRRGKLTLVGGR
ncbi:MAG: PKD domain-containing protein [Bacteroidia bacterium]